ncbi:probable serine carboxypeptidase CPVL [Halichondria panicea]|uniref:probable serine carboxypeptidase CPVL n=1 Tax=Halichondria panicea TaxID=6063 RepID=UPI00312B4E38
MASTSFSFVLLSVLLLPLVLSSPLGSIFHQHKAAYRPSLGADPGDPLYLTPYIKKGDVATAHKLSEVTEKLAGVTSYSGFLTVNETSNGNMFFWFFPAQNGNKDAPLMLWLQGGPGGSSLFGLFNENGPLVVDSSGKVSLRKVTWNTDYHMLYIDNPVGTGFSFTNDSKGFSTNEVEVGINLYSALTQFFTVFSEYQANDFYLTGESYAGKYVPAIGYKIHTENMNNPAVKINLKGLAIGDGLCDPENMMNAYADLVFQFGMVDENQAAYIFSQTNTAVQHIKAKQFYDAFKIFDALLNGDLIPYPTYFYNVTGSTNYYNILRTSSPPDFNYYVPFINTTDIRRAIHVGSLSYGSHAEDVEMALGNDIMDTVRDWLSVLMDNYKVLLYNGQLDIIVGVPLTESMLQVLQWSGRDAYLKADRQVWKIGDDVAGYVRTVNKFMQVVVRGGGHILPFDQPERALNLIQNFVNMQ